jgi:solute carrier family 13 (sodium-dependent dicarboxylate transporter), member 2/3/5
MAGEQVSGAADTQTAVRVAGKSVSRDQDRHPAGQGVANAQPHARAFRWNEAWVIAALVVYSAVRLGPQINGLTELGQAVLGVMLAGTILWVTEAVPLGVTAVLVLALLGLSPGLRLPDIAGGFASDVTFFLIGAAAIGAAVETSGLAARVARFLHRGAGGRPARLYAQMIAALPALAFMIPSAITRNAILIPAYRDALKGMGIGPSGRAGRALMLSLGVLNPLASSALLTGGITSITAATLMGGFSWLRWFVLMAVPYYALIILGGVLLRLMVGRFEPATPDERMAAEAGLFSPVEKRTLAVLAITSVLWLTDALHHLSPAIPALIGAALLLAPRIGVLSWKAFESRLSWGLILTVGTSLSLATMMTKSGVAAWLGQAFLEALSSLTDPHVLIIALIVATAVIHLAITNLAACIALLLPITTTIAQAAGLNPIVCSLVVTIVVDAVILYPVQTAANLLAYETGYFSPTDMRRFGAGMLILTAIVVLLCLPYWALLGLPLRL